ncbi:IucA/IucC family protein [Xanthovirga aplysinae]|uniref:IucA/IucC family protein n=1 Tax=Xanthovirga aplysinae TaxID=2529853 RepID=UPI0012BC8179|nr:IucA/IucC family siderophore biosynthesis protein [Xanthovirga aplysinae]MTI33266.1 IucA/IucC family siderophore biosynthesis protein [Xanthovirga aplysinae]
MTKTMKTQTPALFKGAEVLRKDIWEKVNKANIIKSISELMHELLLKPRVLRENNGKTYFELATDSENISYRFSAEHRQMDYWYIDPSSLVKVIKGEEYPAIDAIAFYTELQQSIGIEPFTLAHFIRESSHTLFADANFIAKGRLTADELADADYQTIEHHMEGHPWATINKGRIGFNVEDYYQHAPESDQLIRLKWVAAHQSRATYFGVDSLPFQLLIEQELGKEKVGEFKNILQQEGVNPEEYLFIPIHDWQWQNKLAFLFGQDIAQNKLIPLGEGEDQYTPQQSIRTFLNVDRPERLYVKMAVSILNTALYRGLSPDRLKVAPAITQYMKARMSNDSFLNACGFVMLGEIATINFRHPHFDQLDQIPYYYKEMLGVIWRESASPFLKEGERMMTMAALMYVDDEGDSLIGSLINKSGLTPKQWMKAYLEAYFKPLIHCFYKHQLCFSPHGENTILVLKDYIPQRVIVKDFVEEINLNQEAHAKLPEEMQPIIRTIEDEFITLFILSGIFDGVFRYISNVSHNSIDGYTETDFWKAVHKIIDDYQKDHPEFSKLFQKFDLFAQEFKRVCINRVRLLTVGYKDDTSFPMPEIVETLKNPIAAYVSEKVTS